MEPLLLAEDELLFRLGLTEMNLDIKDKQIDLILRYFNFLLNKNDYLNLISRKMDLPTQVSNHLLDSLTPLLWAGWPAELKALDLGSGGGLPAIPLSIINSGWDYTLAESTGKKAIFLQEAKEYLNLDNIHILNKFIEPGKNIFSQTFDLVTVRALSELKKLIPLVSPFLCSGGYFIAFKGPKGGAELAEASNTLKKYSLVFHDELNLILPLTKSQRSLLLFIKK